MAPPLPSLAPYEREAGVALDAARQAASAIMTIYTAQSAEVYEKGDGSPVTDADIAADETIRGILAGAFPADALLTEEGENDVARLANRRVWVVDPIDGTAEYVKRSGRFDVFIALAEDGEPVIGVSLQPTTGLGQIAVRGAGAWRIVGDRFEPLRLDPAPGSPRIVSSKWYSGHTSRDAILQIAADVGAAAPPIIDVGFQPRAFDPSLRTYDCFLGFWQPGVRAIAREWDIAASDVIVHEAGGRLTDLWGRRHRYNKRDTRISGGLLVSSDADLHAKMLDALRPHLPATPPSPDPADDAEAHGHA